MKFKDRQKESMVLRRKAVAIAGRGARGMEGARDFSGDDSFVLFLAGTRVVQLVKLHGAGHLERLKCTSLQACFTPPAKLT